MLGRLIESFPYEWETFTVKIRYGYGRNFECFYRDDTATVTIRRGTFSTHAENDSKSNEIVQLVAQCCCVSSCRVNVTCTTTPFYVARCFSMEKELFLLTHMQRRKCVAHELFIRNIRSTTCNTMALQVLYYFYGLPLEKSCPLQIIEICDFQQISIPWKCPKGWKLTFNEFPYHGSVQKVGSWLSTNFHITEVSKRLEVPWKFVGSRKFPWSGEDTIFPMYCTVPLPGTITCSHLVFLGESSGDAAPSPSVRAAAAASSSSVDLVVFLGDPNQLDIQPLFFSLPALSLLAAASVCSGLSCFSCLACLSSVIAAACSTITTSSSWLSLSSLMEFDLDMSSSLFSFCLLYPTR